MGNQNEADAILSLINSMSENEVNKIHHEYRSLSRKISNLRFLASEELKSYACGECNEEHTNNRLEALSHDMMEIYIEMVKLFPVSLDTKELRNNIAFEIRNLIKFHNLIRFYGVSRVYASQN